MNDGRPLVGIDIGSAKVSVVVASEEDDRLVVHGFGCAHHDGARRGVISSLEEVSESVLAAANEAEAMASFPVESAILGIGGMPVQGHPSMASVPVSGRDCMVTREDADLALNACADMSIPPEYRVLDIIPCGFALDGQPGMEDPVGMPGQRLDASAYVLYTNKTHAKTVVQAVNRGSVSVRKLLYEPLAAAEAVLTPDERELGCLLLEIGHATTEWLLFSEGFVIASGAIPVAGRHFTADLAAMLKTTTVAAETTKRMVGVTPDREGLDTQAVEVPALGGSGNQVFEATFAAQVLHERGCDLLINIHRVLVQATLENVPRAGVVLTGGGAQLEGLVEMAEQIFGHRARLGVPLTLERYGNEVAGPEWAVSCGLIRLFNKQHRQLFASNEQRKGILGWLRSAFEDLFEFGGGS